MITNYLCFNYQIHKPGWPFQYHPAAAQPFRSQVQEISGHNKQLREQLDQRKSEIAQYQKELNKLKEDIKTLDSLYFRIEKKKKKKKDQ